MSAEKIYNYFKDKYESRKHNSRIYIEKIDETRNYFIEEINQNDLMCNKHKKVCGFFNFIEQLLILVSTVTGCVSIPAFASIVGIILIEIMSFAIELKICVITAAIKKYKSIINKKEKVAMIK